VCTTHADVWGRLDDVTGGGSAGVRSARSPRRRSLVFAAVRGVAVATAVALAAGVALAGVALVAGVADPWGAETAAAQVTPVDVSGIESAQQQVVRADHRGPISAAQAAVALSASYLSADQRLLESLQSQSSEAAALRTSALGRLSADSTALLQAAGIRDHDRRQVAEDHSQMGVIAVALYTGQFTSLRPSTLHQLETDQQAIIDAAEIETVARILNDHLHTDVAAAAAAQRRWAELTDQVAADEHQAAEASSSSATLAGKVSSQASLVAADTASVAAAEQVLVAAQGALHAALAALAGPGGTSATGLSVLGGSALSPTQLAGWYNAQGFVDLTSAPVQQLAQWYVSSGQLLGIRGDVAFAQAVLETGGFSSPDASQLSNFAGIGHCDSCAAGWAFPSPQGGVVGQEQLLRIFASSSGPPPGAPAPVLASLTPSGQMETGCCPTWESLTGVWATDPTYGTQILSIYGQMLSWAVGRQPG
jgi:hypothetical protein